MSCQPTGTAMGVVRFGGNGLTVTVTQKHSEGPEGVASGMRVRVAVGSSGKKTTKLVKNLVDKAAAVVSKESTISRLPSRGIQKADEKKCIVLGYDLTGSREALDLFLSTLGFETNQEVSKRESAQDVGGQVVDSLPNDDDDDFDMVDAESSDFSEIDDDKAVAELPPDVAKAAESGDKKNTGEFCNVPEPESLKVENRQAIMKGDGPLKPALSNS